MNTSTALRSCSVLALLLAGCSQPTTADTASGNLTASNLSGSQTSDTIQVFNWQDQDNVFPATLSASPTSDFNANNCEFYVSDIGNGNSSADGATTNWIEVYIQTNQQQSGQVLEVGMFTETTDGARTITLGNIVSPNNCFGCYETGYTYGKIEPGTPTATIAQTVQEYAFFIDVQQADGSIARLWQSDGGHNYLNSAVFQGTPGHVYQAGDTTTDYANASSYIFWQKDACANN
jgi:hypothetical protein